MESTDIKKLSEKNFSLDDINKIKKDYLISYGSFESWELKKCITEEKKPFYIKNNFVIGFENNKFINDKNKEFPIERMVKAIIVEDIIKEPEVDNDGDYFAIIGKNNWDDPLSEFKSIFGNLRVGEIYLPPHSAVFNFVKPTEREIKDKIVSSLEGVNVNVFSKDNYIDNCIHEVGHLFWRDCLTYDEKKKFKEHFDHLKPSALFEYNWEKSDEEEVFCTIYKWFVKSLLLNPSFYNILEYEDLEGLNLLKGVLDRISKDRLIADIWELEKNSVLGYLRPNLDLTTGKRIVKSGTYNKIKDIELPDELLNDVNRFQDGVMFINLEKAVVPVDGNKILWEEMEKTKYKSKKPDGKGGWVYEYYEPKGQKKTINSIVDKYKKQGVTLNIYEDKDSIRLSAIKVPKDKQGEGFGTKIMQEIISYSDNGKKTITLTPSTDYGASSVSRLKKFYKNLGFVENKGRNKDYAISDSMYRENK